MTQWVSAPEGSQTEALICLAVSEVGPGRVLHEMQVKITLKRTKVILTWKGAPMAYPKDTFHSVDVLLFPLFPLPHFSKSVGSISEVVQCNPILNFSKSAFG